MRRASVAEASAAIAAGAPYVDVRAAEEFEDGHPAGAYCVPLAEPDFLELMLALFALEAPLVVGCRSGIRSVAAAELLEEEGFTQVLELRPGWDGARDAFGRVVEAGWRKSGLPVGQGDGGERSLAALRARAEAAQRLARS
jgi:rhodanese-related sulfurtransferase